MFVPEKYADLNRLPQGGRYIARGAGLSYSLASAGDEVWSIDMASFNRILSFDAALGIIEVEAGMSIGELNTFLIKHHWILPVLPGYPSITIGGCAAFNVHGKSQYKVGTFSNWVEEIHLFHPAKGFIRCSPANHREWFELTLGGMGFTGIILSVKLRLKKIEGNRLSIKAVKVGNINEAVTLMRDEAEKHDYIYAWNNLNLTGNHFGRGIVYLENHMATSVQLPEYSYQNKLSRFSNLPFTHHALTVKLMCLAYELMDGVKPRQRLSDLVKATFPIYGKEIYYYLFGRKGFREYQVIFSFNNWKDAVQEIQALIKKMNMPIALGSLKIFKGQEHYLSFSGTGVCITIDVPNNKQSIPFFEGLDEISIRYKGIINLSKDSRVGRHVVSKVFTQYDLFKQQLQAYDPDQLFTSELRNRINV